MTDQVTVRTFPCNECPVRCDNAANPRSKFPAHRWRTLRATVDHPEDLLTQPLFACHKGAPGTNADEVCAGWLAAFGQDSMNIRYAVVSGRLDGARLSPGPGWPVLYDDWDEMAAAQQWNPGDPDGHLPIECRIEGARHA